jgi:alpha-tubulin suppressor-like RCC1 family protein
LGNGTTSGDRNPIQVSSLTNVAAVATSYNHSLALKSDGTIWAWGSNYRGKLGNGNTNGVYSKPLQISSLSDIVAIAAGYDHSLALRSDGTVWAWGDNQYGQAGNGITHGTSEATNSTVTTTNDTSRGIEQVSGLSEIVALSAGVAHSLALKSDGTVWTWGYNYYGQLGNGTSGTNSDRGIPVQVKELSGVVSIGSGAYHSLAVKSDGTVWTWGHNNDGQLGDGVITDSSTPVQVIGLNSMVAVAGGENHSLALKSDGTVWVWGYNIRGQLGTNTISDSYTPIQIGNLNGIIAIAANSATSVALKSDGTVWVWGSNFYGQLGNGTSGFDSYSSTPVQVNNLAGITAVAAGCTHVLALTADMNLR